MYPAFHCLGAFGPELTSLKSLNAYAPGSGKRGHQESERQNHNDSGATVDNPNAQGRVMRPVPHQCAGVANYPADGHDTYEKPYPRIQRGAVAGGFGGAVGAKNGPGGSW